MRLRCSKPAAPRVAACALYAAVFSCLTVSPSPAIPAEVIDLRSGTRTTLYGGNFTGTPSAGDFYGWAVAFGDFDGDGFTDFFSSSANSDGPDDTYGPENDVYLIFGGPRTGIDSLYAVDSPGGADIHFYKGGFAMACADVDNDGYDDAILAQVAYSVDPTQGGVYIVFGAPRNQLRTVYDFKPGHAGYTQPDVLITGATWLGGAIINIQGAGYDHASRTLVAGDFNDDGFHDIAVGHFNKTDHPDGETIGATYVIFGRPRGEFSPVIDVDYSTTLPHPDVVIWGEGSDQYPFDLAVGDLDGDGADDLLASTIRGRGDDNVTPFLGEVHGWWGKPKWEPSYETEIETFDFSLQGDPGGYGLGYRIVTGDLDRDGRDELITGSPIGYRAVLPSDRLNMGEYRVIFGRARPLWPKWGNAVEMTDVLILGAQGGEALNLNGPQEWGVCFSLATGDRDGDGYEDLLVGAGAATRPDDGKSTGGAYLLHGRPRSEWDPFYDLRDGHDTIMFGVDGCGGFDGLCTGTGGYTFDRFGFVTGMADIDGSGKDELFLAAPFADGPNNDCYECGEFYILFDPEASAPADRLPPGRPATAITLLSNHPNPFTATTSFRIQAPLGQSVSLTVHDVRGRLVSRPLIDVSMTVEELDVPWSAIDSQGKELPSGVYFARMRVGNDSRSRKVILVR